MREYERGKRLYLFSPDMTLHPSDYEFVNEQEALIDGVRAGRYEHSVSGYRVPVCTGLPHLREKPKLLLRVSDEENDFCDPGPHELQDAYGFGPFFVSSVAQALLSSIDPEGFDFLECETIDRVGTALPSYWMMDAIRVADFDRERSNFTRYLDQFPDSDARNPSILRLNDIYLMPDFPVSHHSFYLAGYLTSFVVDGVVMSAWKSAGLSGARFTPLQPPTQDEYGADKEHPDFLGFVNYPYWRPKT